MAKHTQTRVKKTKRKKRKRRVLIVLLPILTVLFVVGYWFLQLWTTAESVITESYEDDGREKSELRTKVVDPKEDNVSILIMGVDESDHRGNKGQSRTDALILATLNINDKSVKLLSIPRDSLVYIPERGHEDKINHAHYFGGPKSTVETVENLLNIPVDYWVRLNFEAFVQVVDALNGIEVDVPYEFRESNSQDKRDSIHLLPGKQTLNGEEALALARTRKHDNDIERGKRQMEIIKAVIDKALSIGSVLKYDDLIRAVGDNLTTNMTFSEMTSFISYGSKGLNLDVESYTLEGSNYMPGNIYYWKLDEEALLETQTIFRRHLEIDSVETPVSNQNLNDHEQATSVEDEVTSTF